MQVILKHSETNKKVAISLGLCIIFVNIHQCEQLVKGYLQIRKHNQM